MKRLVRSLLATLCATGALTLSLGAVAADVLRFGVGLYQPDKRKERRDLSSAGGVHRQAAWSW